MRKVFLYGETVLWSIHIFFSKFFELYLHDSPSEAEWAERRRVCMKRWMRSGEKKERDEIEGTVIIT